MGAVMSWQGPSLEEDLLAGDVAVDDPGERDRDEARNIAAKGQCGAVQRLSLNLAAGLHDLDQPMT